MALTASDAMTSSVVMVTPSVSVYQVAELLAEQGISGVPVLSGDKRAIGTITETDISSRQQNQTMVRALMCTQTVPAGEGEPASESAFLL